MGLMSFFKRATDKPAAKPVADSADAVQQLRLRARRRLIGATMLVLIGVIGFPLVFETQPRPIPVDLPIEIPRKEAAAPLQIPAAPPASRATVAPVSEPVAEPVATAPTPGVAAASKVEPEAKPKPADRPTVKPVVEPKPSDKVVADKAAADKAAQESARVQALLDGKPAPKASETATARFIVQVGAFGEAKAAQEARMKVEKLGLKTYTQAVETADGKRIRVRVGPYGSRDEADKAAAKVRGTGLSVAVLTL
ncbi:SPOR domain-containing protein [Pelomonas sp. SE-A7]|uniref:SPOR domain-containing protein n=1 Tax=Pelomonas sp. SE-A7 TaxID=3054953 RepID=UPI00259C873B|nr:SPOR domain-containing protein [Pelomonas sp. SE-A7]MDM4765012.1 SPOR domain-containing protein [Pelomonas sp. SE-A7]